MPKLLYISLMRLPTEKAHGLQIMQNCEAFADAGCDVTLWVARRWNTREMRAINDPYAHYGVQPNFRIRRIPCIDVFPLFPPDGIGARLAYYLMLISYTLISAILLLFTRADIFYSRDEVIVSLLSAFKAERTIAYESHLFAPPGRGTTLQRHAASHAGSVIAITAQLREDLVRERLADPARTIVAHDGVRRARFSAMPDKAAARLELGWAEDAFIVGFVGRLQMLGLDKGVGNLIDVLASVDGAHLALVGGPDELAAALRKRWLDLGLPAERFLYAGQVPPESVPLYLSAFDICAMPHPAATQFALYTSPLKLFEYMAAGKAIVASELPAWSDVVSDGETALLLPPDDIVAWTEAIKRLRDDRALRRELGMRARERALTLYTWDARAQKILAHLRKAPAIARADDLT